ncbi:hypothetical protein QAD02_017383 [Eretmocerus hayati]|uniref:Uncharacterized protein n=1 Tax=Eretmocerus hayati TaxID=131215 RepID=A0ACC2PDQ5_9HYME|nr:hypothetical protein QAD02_017383 [Eretmocerus hayati]
MNLFDIPKQAANDDLMQRLKNLGQVPNLAGVQQYQARQQVPNAAVINPQNNVGSPGIQQQAMRQQIPHVVADNMHQNQGYPQFVQQPAAAQSNQNRSVGGWLQSSFDLDDEDDKPQRKRAPSKSTVEDGQISASSFSYKKKPTGSLSALLSACAPQKASELAVSRQKQQEINRWFQNKAIHDKPNLLIVCGPSGCGKTETLKVLAKENCFDIVEWITPIDQVTDEYNRIMRQGERFEEFLIRATRYNSVLSNCGRRLLLVKEIPNSYIEERDDFSGLLQRYCQYGRDPLVFIHTETSNSRLMMTLFSQNNRDKFGIDVININAATPTALKNVMKRVSSILNSKASHLLRIRQNEIDEVLSSTIGDVRSALLNLIFCSLKTDAQLKKECTVREETLSLLHGIGRVTNPKKNISGTTWKFVHDPDDLAAFFHAQSNTFVKFIHENYLNTIGSNLNGAADAVDAVSLADIFNSEWNDINLTKLALSYCIRGVMVANDKPVSQWNPVRKPSTAENDVRRNFSLAEIQWYERYILPKSKDVKDKLDEDELSDSMTEIIEC